MKPESAGRSAPSISKLELRNLLLKSTLPPPTQGRGGNRFPNVLVKAHDGNEFLFHSQLIANKVVIMHFFSLQTQQHFPSLQHTHAIAQRLGDRLGKDVHIYSITTAPEQDSLERLAAYANTHQLPKGWLMLHPKVDGAKAISQRFGKHLSRHSQHNGVNMRMVHYGNGGVGIWGAFAIDGDVEMALSRIAWLKTGNLPSGMPKQAGPIALNKPIKDVNSNREVRQTSI